MTAKGHFLFSITFVIFSKKIALTALLAEDDWWHILTSAILTCLLPDVDHPRSLLGQRFIYLSKLIAKLFGHRGFTHSILAVIIITITLHLKLFYLNIHCDVIHGILLGYISHIIADIFTPAGVSLLWPYRWRFRLPILVFKNRNKSEYIFCMIFFVLTIFPHSILINFFSKDLIYKIINFKINYFIDYLLTLNIYCKLFKYLFNSPMYIITS